MCRRIASWPSVKTDLKNAGAEWVDEEMVRDGNLVSSRKPDDIPAFNRGMIELFQEKAGNRAAQLRLRYLSTHSRIPRSSLYSAWDF